MFFCVNEFLYFEFCIYKNQEQKIAMCYNNSGLHLEVCANCTKLDLIHSSYLQCMALNRVLNAKLLEYYYKDLFYS